MEWLVGTLLKMAKLDADAITFDMEKVSVRALLEAALKPLAILLEIKNQTTDLRNDLELYCDKRWMSEALTNLIKNASEHSGDHTCITIDCGENPHLSMDICHRHGEGNQKGGNCPAVHAF